MIHSQKLELRRSLVRQRLAELSGVDELDDAMRDETDKLTTEWTDLETRHRAAIVAEGEERETHQRDFDDDPAARKLSSRSSVGEIFEAALEHRSTQGATAELQQHFKLSGNQIPLELLRGDGPLETRAVTPAPSDTQANQQPIIGYVFPQSVAAFLGVAMPVVGVGEAVFPVLTKKTDVHTPIENAAAAETTGSFSADVLSPARIQAAFYYSRESAASFAGMDEALRMNLSAALSDGIDAQVVNGSDGLLSGTNLPNHNVTSETTYALYRSQLLMSRIDGRYASTADDIRLVVGSGTYAHADAVWRGSNTNNDTSILDVLVAKSGGVRVSAHVPAVASTRQNVIVRRGMNRDMVAAVWQGVTLVPDEISLAASGQIRLTAILLFAVKIVRTDGFFKQQIQIS